MPPPVSIRALAEREALQTASLARSGGGGAACLTERELALNPRPGNAPVWICLRGPALMQQNPRLLCNTDPGRYREGCRTDSPKRARGRGGLSQGQSGLRELGWKGTNEISILPAPHQWHHLTALSIYELTLGPLFQREKKIKNGEKTCLFFNRTVNLCGLGVIGHLHGRHSNASAITTGL